jgi:5-methylthioadenosine/S-adenosylhomocysteine deaminase
VSYNPVASQWKGNGVAPALEYARQGVRFGLGTDATRNDAFRLMDAAEVCQRLIFGLPNDDFSCGAGWLWLDAATRAGADVAGLGAVTGRLEPGFEADFLVLDMASPEVLPSWDFSWELVRYYDRANIRATFVAGKPGIVDGKPVGLDLDDFMRTHLPLGIRSIREADIVRLHGPSAGYRPRP